MRTLTFFLFLIFGSFLSGQAVNSERIAVMDIIDESGTLSDKEKNEVTLFFYSRLTGKLNIIDMTRQRTQLDRMVREGRIASHKICVDPSCQIQLGRELSANFIYRSRITKLGQRCTFTAELINLTTKMIEKGKGAFSDFTCGDMEGLSDSVEEVVNKLTVTRRPAFKEGPIGTDVEPWDPGDETGTIVKFSSDPPEAVVLLNGRILCQKTPCSRMVKEGEYEVSMQKENYLPKIKVETIKESGEINYALEPNFGWVSINSKVPVDVVLNGQKIGKTPVEKRVVNPGPHQVETYDRCFHPAGEKFFIERGDARTIDLELREKESAIRVRIKDDRENDLKGNVIVDGNKVGVAPGTFKIPLCSREVVIKSISGEYAEQKEELALIEREVTEIFVAAVKTPPKKETGKEKMVPRSRYEEITGYRWEWGINFSVGGGGYHLYRIKNSSVNDNGWYYYFEAGPKYGPFAMIFNLKFATGSRIKVAESHASLKDTLSAGIKKDLQLGFKSFNAGFRYFLLESAKHQTGVFLTVSGGWMAVANHESKKTGLIDNDYNENTFNISTDLGIEWLSVITGKVFFKYGISGDVIIGGGIGIGASTNKRKPF